MNTSLIQEMIIIMKLKIFKNMPLEQSEINKSIILYVITNLFSKIYNNYYKKMQRILNNFL